MTTRKKVIVVKNDEDAFEKKLNSIDGFATQISTCCNDKDVFFTAVIFYKED